MQSSCMGTVDLNSDPDACAADSLLTEPSFQALLCNS